MFRRGDSHSTTLRTDMFDHDTMLTAMSVGERTHVQWINRGLKGCALLLVVVAAVFAPKIAFAQSKTELLAQRLEFPPRDGRADDFRVRTNAALALGASNDDEAVSYLCRGLNDPNETVRLAVIAGLRKLNRAAAGSCVKDRVPVESSSTVREQLEQLAGVLSSAPSGSERFVPRNIPDATVYVALAKIENRTGKPELEKVVLNALRSKLDELNLQIAPDKETLTEASSVMKKRKLKGYYLSVVLDPMNYDTSGLRAKVNVAVATYPGKDIRGSFSPSASLPGVATPSTRSESMLLEALSANVAQKFAENFK